MRYLALTPLLAVMTFVSCAEPPKGVIDWEAVAETITQRMSLQSGERVLLLGRAGQFDDLVPSLRAAVQAAGAVDLGALSVSSERFAGSVSPFLTLAETGDRAALKELFRDVDIAVMLPGAALSDPAYAAMQDLLGEGHGRTIHFHWSGAYDLNGNAIAVTDVVSAAYQTALLETDYAALSASQEFFESSARGEEIHVTTPRGTDIRFRIGDRPVTKQDGDASAQRATQARNLIDREIELPAGAIRVAPLEDTVEGTIAFPPSVWNGETVEGLKMYFKRGKVVRVEANRGLAAVEAELDGAGTAGRSFREFALGFNPLLAIPDADAWIPYYGYGAGVVRLSLGDNSELGGTVSGGYVRWNFFTDATVTVGGNTWVEDGQLLSR
ncbi:MAG: aminopeptidase [Gemmatimonadetes bacterium]|nr:aminopeptidase [Gemmatimonadota bacterium]